MVTDMSAEIDAPAAHRRDSTRCCPAAHRRAQTTSGGSNRCRPTPRCCRTGSAARDARRRQDSSSRQSDRSRRTSPGWRCWSTHSRNAKTRHDDDDVMMMMPLTDWESDTDICYTCTQGWVYTKYKRFRTGRTVLTGINVHKLCKNFVETVKNVMTL